MRAHTTLSAILCAGVAAIAMAAASSTDPLTKLPVPAAAAVLNIEDAPRLIPNVSVCRSTAQMNFYTPRSGKVDAAIAWYSANLQGFQRAHNYTQGRSQDTFYNDQGTLMVSVTGEPAGEGKNSDVYAVIYGTISPGVSGKIIAGINAQKIVC